MLENRSIRLFGENKRRFNRRPSGGKAIVGILLTGGIALAMPATRSIATTQNGEQNAASVVTPHEAPAAIYPQGRELVPIEVDNRRSLSLPVKLAKEMTTFRIGVPMTLEEGAGYDLWVEGCEKFDASFQNLAAKSQTLLGWRCAGNPLAPGLVYSGLVEDPAVVSLAPSKWTVTFEQSLLNMHQRDLEIERLRSQFFAWKKDAAAPDAALFRLLATRGIHGFSWSSSSDTVTLLTTAPIIGDALMSTTETLATTLRVGVRVEALPVNAQVPPTGDRQFDSGVAQSGKILRPSGCSSGPIVSWGPAAEILSTTAAHCISGAYNANSLAYPGYNPIATPHWAQLICNQCARGYDNTWWGVDVALYYQPYTVASTMFPWMTHGTYSGGIQGQGAAYLDVTNNTGNFIDGIPTCMEGASDLKFGSSFQYHDHGTMCGTHSYYDVYGFGRVDLWDNNVVCGGDSGSYIRRNNGPGGSSTAVGLTSFRASAVSENGQCSRTTSTDTATVGFSRMWRINEWAQEAFGVSMKAWGTP